VSAHDRDPGLSAFLNAAAQHRRDDVCIEIFGKRGDCNRAQRCGAHSVDAIESVRRGDAAEIVGIVDDGRGKIYCADERSLGIELENVLIRDGQFAQNLREDASVEVRCSTHARRKVR
jgi:hypothetical protein